MLKEALPMLRADKLPIRLQIKHPPMPPTQKGRPRLLVALNLMRKENRLLHLG